MKYIKLTLICSVLACLAVSTAQAQIIENALKFGEIGGLGTARIQGLGGAGYSLGGDVSAAAINPAGLGFFNRSTIVFTPTFSYTGTDASFVNQSSSLSDTHLGISNFGIVFNNNKEDVRPSNWRGGSFGITYNKVSRQHLDYTFGPADNDFSLLDDIALQANGNDQINKSNLDYNVGNDRYISYADAAYRNYLLNPTGAGNTFVSSIPDGTLADQDGTIKETSTVSQWNFAYGGNFQDKLYFGASIGFKSFSQKRTNQFDEYYKYTLEYRDFINQGGYYFPDPDGNISLDSVVYNGLDETQSLNGTGINANLGIIYRPINEVTIGLSYQTPTAYSVSEDYQYTLSSAVNGIIDSGSKSDDPFDLVIDGTRSGVTGGIPILTQYRLVTPSRLGAGISYFFQKYGFLTADVEYVNYKSSQFNSSDFSTGYLNERIDQNFKSSINYKVGGEFRYDIFRFRLGYAMYATPVRSADNLNRDRRVLSAGIGVNTKKFFADLAVTNSSYNTNYQPYAYASYFPSDARILSNKVTQASLTFGFNF